MEGHREAHIFSCQYAMHESADKCCRHTTLLTILLHVLRDLLSSQIQYLGGLAWLYNPLHFQEFAYRSCKLSSNLISLRLTRFTIKNVGFKRENWGCFVETQAVSQHRHQFPLSMLQAKGSPFHHVDSSRTSPALTGHTD